MTDSSAPTKAAENDKTQLKHNQSTDSPSKDMSCDVVSKVTCKDNDITCKKEEPTCKSLEDKTTCQSFEIGAKAASMPATEKRTSCQPSAEKTTCCATAQEKSACCAPAQEKTACCAPSEGLELELQTSFHVWYQTDLSREHAEELLVKQPIGKSGKCYRQNI